MTKTRWGEDVPLIHPNDSLRRMAQLVVENLKDCPTCGDRRRQPGLTVKCRDWHEICQCGQPYDKPKNPGCRRRKHPKEEKP